MPQHAYAGIRDLNFWSVTRWGGATALLAVPLVAMMFGDAVRWTPGDFVFAGVMIYGTVFTYERVVARRREAPYRLATVFALGAVFLLVWINAAVGIIGNEDRSENFIFAGVLVAALGGAVGSGLAPAGMARAMAMAALAQALASVFAFGIDLRSGVLSSGFIILWGVAAALYRQAAHHGGRDQRHA